MKQSFKRTVSMFLVILTVMAAVPAFAAETTVTAGTSTDMSWYKEDFEGSTVKATLTSGSKQYADISSDSATVEEADGNKAYKLSSTANTASSGGFGGLVTTKLSAGKESDFFTIKYRIKFENAQRAASLGSFRSEGGLARVLVFDANGSVAVDGNEYKIGTDGRISFAGAVLNEGWNNIEMVYDASKGKAAIILNGNCVTVESVATYAQKGFKGITIAPTATADIYIDDIEVSDSAVYINELDGVYLATENVEFNAVLPSDFETAAVISEGKKIADITKTDGVNSYNVSIGCDKLAQGENDITVSAKYKSGTRKVEKTVKVIANSDGATSWRQDMSAYTADMTDTNAVVSALGLNGMSLQNVATLVRSTGLGGKAADDVSLGFANNTSAYSSAWTYFDKNVTASSGKVSISFDVYDGCGNGNQKDKLLIQGKGNSAGYQIISITAPIKQWITVNLIIDLDAGTYTLTDNNGTTTGAFTLTSISNLRFRACIYANNGIPVSYDNISVMTYSEPLAVTVKGYKVSGLGLTEQTTVPAGVDTVLEANKDIASVSGKVLKSDGTEVENATITSAGKEITVEAELAEGSYTVVLDGNTVVGTTALGTNVKIPVTVTDEKKFTLADNKISDNTFTATYYTIGARPWIIAAAYNGDTFVDVKYMYATDSVSDINFAFDKDIDSVKLFTLKSTATISPLTPPETTNKQ